MGKDVAAEFPAAQRVFDEVDEALGISLSSIMWEGPEEELTLTHNAQPAILTHSLAVYAVVRDALNPVIGAGHSLGEYSAYAAAGALTLADAARLVRRRGELMLQAGKQRPGTMTAVIGLASEDVEQICADASVADSVVVPANVNAPGQTVVSGDPEAVRRAGEGCKAAGAKRVLPLKVSGAFHSPLMEPAETGLKLELAAVTISQPAFPVVANATAEPVYHESGAIAQLGAQLTSPVRWVESMQCAAQQAGDNARFVEVGPGKVLSGLLKRIVPGSESTNLSTAKDIGGFMERTDD
jgi:[acyl-carrier-protein] S-malonyltransferase